MFFACQETDAALGEDRGDSYGDFGAGYAELTEAQRAFADVLTMALSTRLTLP